MTNRPWKMSQRPTEYCCSFAKTLPWLCESPSFKSASWDSLLKLTGLVSGHRLQRVDSFQDHHNLSDPEVFEKLWQPIIDMLIETERMKLHPSLKKLGQHDLEGVLRTQGFRSLRPPTMKFLDALAEARDKLWTEYRCRENPSVMTLRPPWPQGLPIQYLFNFKLVEGPACLPYIESRAKAVVFGAPEMYLATCAVDTDSKEAIGEFVDCWSDALRIYVQGATPDGRAERIKRAWIHATESLSQGRMTLEEAHRFWTPYFRASGVKADEIEADEPHNALANPTLPLPKDPSQPVEWNPDSVFKTLPAYTEDRQLTQTYLDVALQWDHDVFERTSTIPGLGTGDLWRLAGRKGQVFSAATADAFIAAAILYMNSHEGADTSLMMQPFPSAEDARFPAVYLQEEFLERKKYEVRHSSDTLEKFREQVPVALLSRLASSLLQRIEEAEDPEMVHYGQVVSVVKMVSRSDNPAAASSLVQEFMVKLSRESSWHRVLFNHGFLLSLPPQQAQDIIRAFASALFENMQSSDSSTASQTGSKSGHVKVSTLKMLAQVLRDAPYVTPRFSVSILTEMLHHTKHLDIHFAVLTSLVSTLQSSTDAGLKSDIFEALRQYAVPRAASLNERRPETEADWQAAEEGGPLPEVWDDHIWPPVLNLLLHAYELTAEKEISELLYEALRLSTAANRRWTCLFMKRHGFELPDNESLPQVPSFRKALGGVFGTVDDPEGVLFEAWKRYILVNLKPGAGLAGITASIKRDHELAVSNAGKHWLSLWDNQQGALSQLGGHKAASSFSAGSPDGTDGVGASGRLEQLVWDIVDVLLMQAKVKDFEDLVFQLADDWREPMNSPDCRSRAEVILQGVVDRVDALRTPEWLADPQRQPVVLPDTFNIRLKMVELLQPPRYMTAQDALAPEQVDYVSLRIVSLIDDLATGTVPYHDDFIKLKKTLGARFYRSDKLAFRLGSPESVVKGCAVPSIVDLLRVDVAAYMFHDKVKYDGNPKYWDADGAETYVEIMDMWERSSAESIRDVARQFNPLED